MAEILIPKFTELKNKRINMEEFIRAMPKNERKDFLRKKIQEYRSGPEGCASYITECLVVPRMGVGFAPLEIWDIQIKLIHDMVTFLFDPAREMYVINGSRQCGKTTIVEGVCDWLMTFYDNYAISLMHADEGRGGVTCGEIRELASRKCAAFRQKYLKNQLQHQIRSNNSSLMLQSTQKSKKKESTDTGRGMKAALLWIDEAAYVDIEKLEESIFPMTSTSFQFCKEKDIPHGIIMTSTPNGRQGIGKKFYEYWKDFESGTSSIGGFRLHWRDIPTKDEAWFQREREKLHYNDRKINQEYELVFYGAEGTLFPDETIAEIQNRMTKLEKTLVITNKIVGTFVTMDCQQYLPIMEGRCYAIGVDNSKGLGQDYSVIEVYDYDSMDQVMECKNSLSQTEDLVDAIDTIVKSILIQKGKCVILIESNIGNPIISGLHKLDDMYRTLIMRDTIGPDNSKKKSTVDVDYTKCNYGVTNSTVSRPLLIGSVFYHVAKNLDKINSLYLLTEIESLEEKDGKVEGFPHDDAVFASAYCWMVKQYGRQGKIRQIFESCLDFQPGAGGSKLIKVGSMMTDAEPLGIEMSRIEEIRSGGITRIPTTIGSPSSFSGNMDSSDYSDFHDQFSEVRKNIRQHREIMLELDAKARSVMGKIDVLGDTKNTFDYLEKERTGKNKKSEDAQISDLLSDFM